MNEKRVKYSDYCNELDKLREKFPGINFYTVSLGHKDPIQMGVNWPAMGTKSPSATAAFAEKLGNAALAAEDFKYNGYVIDYT